MNLTQKHLRQIESHLHHAQDALDEAFRMLSELKESALISEAHQIVEEAHDAAD